MHEGSCLCKKIRYEISQELGDFGYCHCVSCRKASGSGHAANAPVRRQNSHLLDELYPTRAGAKYIGKEIFAEFALARAR